MSWLSSIYYEDNADYYIHVARHGLDEAIYIEIGDKCDPASCIAIPYEQAIDMATKLLGFADWQEEINRRNNRRVG